MLALRAPCVFDGQSFLAGGATVLLDGGRIVGVESFQHALPDGCELLGYDDATILPGLFECHAHLVTDSGVNALDRVAGYSPEEIDAVVTTALQRQLDAGVTTVRDLGDRRFCVVERRDAQRRTTVEEPTIVASGPPITSPGGHCFFLGGEVSNTTEIVAAVQERADRHVDVVKVMASGGFNTPSSDMLRPQFSADELRLIVDQAHAAGLPVTAHAHAAEAVEWAVAAGVDGLEHASYLSPPPGGRGQPGMALSNASTEALERLARSEIPVCPTVGGMAAALLEPTGSHVQALMQKHGVSPEMFLESVFTHLRRMQQFGVRFISGTDAGIGPGKAHGNYHLALTDLAQVLPVAETLASATSAAAEVCGLGEHKGRVVPGYDADITVVAGDASQDIGAVAHIRAVFLRGRQVR